MSGREDQYYRRPHSSQSELGLELAHDVMSREQFRELDERQENFMIETAHLFPVNKGDEGLKVFTSDYLKHRFEKGDRQFAAGGEDFRSGKQLARLQQDFRLGNTNTCAERLLLDAAHTEGLTLGRMAVYRGENVELVNGQLQTLQKRGGNGSEKEKNTMRHLVCPCAYCREGLCHHNKTAMIIMPPGVLNVGKNTIKLPAFMTYPEDDLFQAEDPLELELRELGAGASELLTARKMQKVFFKTIAKKYPLTDADKALVIDAHKNISKQLITEDPYVLIRARTITNETIEKSDEVAPSPKRYSYLDYKRNDVELRFVDEVLEVPHLPSDPNQTGSSHALHVFLELYRGAGKNENNLILPNADTRQRIIERFRRSFILTRMDGEIVKIPTILLYPNRYKRFDKQAGRM